MRAIGITCGIGSMVLGARQAGFKIEGNVEWRKYYHEKDEYGRNTFTENFPGAVFTSSRQRMTDEEFERFSNADLALGHPESHPDLPVYTSKGWKLVSTLSPGDLVLTHKGRFRPILAVYNRTPGPDTEKITFSRSSRKSGSSITLAGNHPVLMEDGTWKKAREVRKGEKITYLCEECPKCKELTPVSTSNRPTCYCQLKKTWNNRNVEEKASVLAPAHRATRHMVSEGSHPFTDSSVRQKAQLVQGQRSKAEILIADALSHVQLAHQFPVGKYFVDLAVPELKIAIEVDGGNWHNERHKREGDLEKESFLKKEGWVVIRAPVRLNRLGQPAVEKAIQDCVLEFERIAKNHRGEYRFASFVVGGLWRDEFPGDEKLYDLSVEEDHSYVVSGLVVHNCGNFSQLSGANADKHERLLDPADIPLFVDLVAEFRPRFFVMDDLPKSFMAFPMAEYAARLPDYDLYPEWISNWGYGNVQWARKRMFMLGSLKSERWAFRPGEASQTNTVAQTLSDLPSPSVGSNYPNHDPHAMDSDCPRAGNMQGYGTKSTWRDVKYHFSGKPGGYTMAYIAKDGRVVNRIGFLKGHWDGPSHVLTGGNATLHHHRCEPYTIRERARIQGFPDDFVFYGTKLNDRGEWDHATNQHMVRQTGKAMPIQFCRYVSSQIASHIKGKDWECTDTRILRPNSYIDEAKTWYCANVGYSNQEAACRSCWLRKTCSMSVVPEGAKGPGISKLIIARR